MDDLRVAVVLGGGGARGLAHIGVLRVFEEHHIPIHIVTGTSMGALVGALYAQNPDAIWVERRVRHFLNSEEFKKTGKNYFKEKSAAEPDDLLHILSREIKKRVVINLAAQRTSLMKGERLQLAIEHLLDDNNIEDFRLPFACSAGDLKSGETVVFKKGSIRQAIRASAAIPGFIPPLEYENKLLIDGSICDNFPIAAAIELGANFIIAIDVTFGIDPQVEITNVIDIVIRGNQLATKRINELLLERTDCIITPDTASIHWSAFERYEELVLKGKEAARREIILLKKVLDKKGSFYGKLSRGLRAKAEQWFA